MIITNPVTNNKYYFNWDNDACRLTILMAAVEPIYNQPILIYLCPHPERLSQWEMEQADKECKGWRDNLPNLEDWD